MIDILRPHSSFISVLLPEDGLPISVINADFMALILTFKMDNSSSRQALLSFPLINLYTSV